MSLSTAIEWTDSTWNPVTGCTKISSGCANCYAERLALRLQAMRNPSYRDGFSVTLHKDALELPLKWKKPQSIFVNSMSDLFHEDIPLEFIQKIFDIMHRAKWHRFQILTKRAERMLELNQYLSWSPNIWMGVTVENIDNISRIEYLKGTNATVKFLSLEPLLSSLPNLNLNGINWVIVGGESGPKSRPIKEDWVIDIKNQCKNENIPFFFKQWGGINKKKAGRELEGRIWSETPSLLPSAQLSF
jgi:protein gp37